MRYIEIDSIIEQIKAEHCERCKHDERCALCDIDEVLLMLEEADDADVVEVKHGEWRAVYSNSMGIVYECSECCHLTLGTSDYCICGAKMDGERKGE